MDGKPRPKARLLAPALLVLLVAVLAIAALVCSKSPEEAKPDSPGGPPEAGDGTILGGATLRMLVVGDPFALALQKAAAELGREAGGTVNVEVVGYNDVRRMVLQNAHDNDSAYQIVSFDAVWSAEYGEDGVLLPLNDLIAASKLVDPRDFLAIAYRSGRHKDKQIGLPIQPHSELLWYRKDLFEQRGIKPPTTTDELLAAARSFNDPEKRVYGICWNGQRGQALGQQIAHFYGAFGQPLLDASGKPTLNTPKAVAVAKFALALLPVSPPDVLQMAWDQRPRRIAQNGAVMTYEWAARAYLAEEDPTSQVAGKIGYAAAPSAPGEKAVTPTGTWNLGIPANIGARRDVAWRFLEWLTSSRTLKLLANRGNGGMPRTSILRDPELTKRYPVFITMDELNQKGQLDDWMRPAVPQWADLADILGTVFHDMLLGQMTAEQAVATAQEQAEKLFEKAR